jgi:tetratricopeptide (TPR) repeat protein
LGYAYLFKKDYTQALIYFNNAGGEFSFAGRARSYIEQGKYQEAIQEYMNYFNAYSQGKIYDGMKKAFVKQALYYSDKLLEVKLVEKAESYLSKIAELFPKDDAADEALIKLSDLCLKTKKYDSALYYICKALNNNPTYYDDQALYQKGIILYQMNRKKEALDVFKDFKSRYPQSVCFSKADEWVKLIQKDLQY